MIARDAIILRIVACCSRPPSRSASARRSCRRTIAKCSRRLPEQRDPALAALKRLQRASRGAPNDLRVATRYARGAIEASRATGDPRYLGQAQAALAPWWTVADAPAPALLLRATIKQSLHDFEGALRDLDRLLARHRATAQARLTRATVRTVLGRYDDAIADCDALEGVAPALVTAVCRADVASRSGRAEEAYVAGHAGARRRTRRSRACARGRVTLAARNRRAAWRRRRRRSVTSASRSRSIPRIRTRSARTPTGCWTPVAARGRRAARGRTRATTRLLLRRVLALQRAARPARRYRGGAHRARGRVDAARRRGDGVHRREEARYALEIERDAAAAVKLARANWNVQREPADLRILAESARAAGDASALRIVSDWMSATRLEDVRVQSLLKGGA